MILEFSAGAIVFYRAKDKIFYLVLKSGYGHWGFPKGRIGDEIKGESTYEAALREVREETGLRNVNFLRGFKKRTHYFFRRQGKLLFKTVTFFLAESNSKNVILNFESTAYEWLDFESALRRLTYGNDKKCLKEANKLLLNSKNYKYYNFSFKEEL